MRFRDVMRNPWYLAYVGFFAATLTLIAKLAGIEDNPTLEGWMLAGLGLMLLAGTGLCASMAPRLGKEATA